MSKKPSNMPSEIRDLVKMSRKGIVLFAAAEHEIFDAISPFGSTAAQVGRKRRLNARAAEIVLNALAAMGMLRKRGDAYFNTPLTRRYLVSTSPDSVIASLQLSNQTTKGWSGLDEILKTGKGAVEPVPGRGGSAREAAIFARAMSVGAGDAAKALPKMADLSGCRNLIDLGGGAGHFSYYLCKAYPRLTATVFDLPPTIRETRKYLKEYGMGRRMKAVAGNFARGELPAGFDAALISQIIHSLGEKENVALLRKIHRCLNPGGILIVRDFLLNRDRISPFNAALFAVNMLVRTKSGRTYTFDEVKEWMRAAGFTRIRRAGPPAFGDASVMTALKPAARAAN
jgi:predicted O-methyltransferase YrrM